MIVDIGTAMNIVAALVAVLIAWQAIVYREMKDLDKSIEMLSNRLAEMPGKFQVNDLKHRLDGSQGKIEALAKHLDVQFVKEPAALVAKKNFDFTVCLKDKAK
jgi:hypothetical protein